MRKLVISFFSPLEKVKVYFSTCYHGNMAIRNVEPEEDLKAINNRLSFFNDVGVFADDVFVMKPVFSDKIKLISHRTQEFLKDNNDPIEADALVTYYRGIFLGCCFSDCLPVVIYEEKYQEIVALVHAGRKNLTKILPKTIEFLENEFNLSGKNLEVVFGPYIHKESYVFNKGIGESVVQEQLRIDPLWRKYIFQNKEKIHLDLGGCAEHIIHSYQIPSENIFKIDIDTHKSRHLYSYHSKQDGKMFLGIAGIGRR